MTGLPEEFKKKMEGLLGEEYTAFISSYDRSRVQGLRINLLKLSEKEGEQLLAPFHLTPVPWAEEGYYYEEQTRPGRHPFHAAGLYYIQEPSAMAVVSLLDVQPGDRVLDLCAAPGGKTTHIAGRLQGKGFLLSNEIHPSRARILSQNVERMGISRGVVTNEEPSRLAERFPEFFDKVVVDAPCSGEGMFRKEETAREEWSKAYPMSCALRQQEILRHGAAMLKRGGILVYSTCTFSPEEDEQIIEQFLESHSDFEIADRDSLVKSRGYEGLSEGRPQWGREKREELRHTFRIWPHLAKGEGHYIAVLRKKEEGEQEEESKKGRRRKTGAGKGFSYIKDKKLLEKIEIFLKEICPKVREWESCGKWILFGEQLCLMPEEIGDMEGLRVLRPGLHVADFKKARLEPAHSLALWLKREEAACCQDLDMEEALRYLRGETIAGGGKKGWTLMCVAGYPLGWAKGSAGILKNHYPKGLRLC
ncbi:RsmB/NOP family class I SAM-dependent RNA methyltransferase [Lachnospiraceae bacterium 62-35]